MCRDWRQNTGHLFLPQLPLLARWNPCPAILQGCIWGQVYTMTPCVGQSAPSILLARVIGFLVVTRHTLHPPQLRRFSPQAFVVIGEHTSFSCWRAWEKMRGLGLWQKSREHLRLEQGLSTEEAELRNPETGTPSQWHYLSLDEALLPDTSVL